MSLGWAMSRNRQRGFDRAKATMQSALLVYDSARTLSETRMESMVDEDGERPMESPKEILGSAILFAVAIELALNGIRMEERAENRKNKAKSRPKNTGRHDLGAIFRSLSKENRGMVANEVAMRGWRVEAVLNFHEAMVMDWRYPVERMSADRSLFWWGPQPLMATFEGILATWKMRYPKAETVTSREDLENLKQRLRARQSEIIEQMNAARVIKCVEDG